MEEIVFCKIQDLLKSYYLFTTVKDDGKDGFHLILCDGNDSWEGDISDNDIHDQCSLTNMDYQIYVKMTVQALTGMSSPDVSFQYEVDHSSKDFIQLHWKKYIVNDDIKITNGRSVAMKDEAELRYKFRLGSTKLRPCDDSHKTIQKIFDHCIKNISNLNHKITSTQMDNERLSQERANALKRLDNCVSAKENLEQDLYSKFLLVLNSKKKEIAKLRQQVENHHHDSKKADNSGTDEQLADENSSAYSVETEKDESDDEKPIVQKQTKLNDDSLVFTDDSLDEDMDILPRNQKPEMKKRESSKASLSKNSSGSKVMKIKEERQSPMFGNKSSADMSDLLDDF